MALKICIKKTKEIFLQSLGQEFCTKTRMYLLSLNLNKKLVRPLSNEYKPAPTAMMDFINKQDDFPIGSRDLQHSLESLLEFTLKFSPSKYHTSLKLGTSL
jgi:hypothetical protein